MESFRDRSENDPTMPQAAGLVRGTRTLVEAPKPCREPNRFVGIALDRADGCPNGLNSSASIQRYLGRHIGRDSLRSSTFAVPVDSVMAVVHRSPIHRARPPCPTLPAFYRRSSRVIRKRR